MNKEGGGGMNTYGYTYIDEILKVVNVFHVFYIIVKFHFVNHLNLSRDNIILKIKSVYSYKYIYSYLYVYAHYFITYNFNFLFKLKIILLM